MALVRNGRNIFTSPGKFTGVFSGQTGNAWDAGGLRNRASGLEEAFSAYPSGHLAPTAFQLPMKPGAMSSYTLAQEEMVGSADLIPARNLEASSSATISILNAQLDQIVSLVASGSMSVSVASAILAGAANAVASSSASLTAVDALLGAIFSVAASGSATLSKTAVLTALAHISADIGGPTPLSPEGLANAVLDALLADHNDAGSVGEALNDLAAGANPWAALLSSNNDPGSFGERIQKLALKTGKYY